jgi:alkaline phosphatase
MIADGWGQTKIDAANMYTGSSPLYQTDPQWTKHWMTTYPYGCNYDTAQAWGNFSYVLNCVTDSAAAATALYSGIKTQNSRLSVSSNGVDRLFTIGEVAKTFGAGVGAITTVPVTDASPGAMVAHNDSRANYYAIADEGFFGDPNTTGMPSALYYGGGHGPTFPVGDVLIGDGRDSYVSIAAKVKLRAEKGSLGDPGRNTAKHYLVERQAGWDAGLLLMQAAMDPYVTKLGGLFDQVYRRADGSGYNPENPTLSESTDAALKVLSKNPNGFVLMIEGGAVDWAGHANNMDYVVGEMIDFNEAVQTVINWVNDTSNDSNWNNTLLIVTGDHETGYLTAGPGRYPNQPIGPVTSQTLSLEKIYSGSGGRRASWDDWHNFGVIDSDETVYWAWNTGGHANVLIPLYTSGVGSGLFENCIDGSDQVRGNFIDNTDIARVMESALSGITTTGSLSIIPGQELHGNPIDITEIVTANNATNLTYTVTEDGSCPAQTGMSIITRKDTWKYNGNNLGNIGTTWKNTAYDDSGWSSGKGILGYGESYITTTVGWPGTDPISDPSQQSLYFRKTFNICNPSAVTSLIFNATYDDAMVVYINGTRVAAAGVAGDPPVWNIGGTPNGAVGHESNQIYAVFDLTSHKDKLVSGTNVIAVGIYNDTYLETPPGPALSSDMVFDGELVVSSNGSSGPLFTGSSTQAQSVSTAGWTLGVKNIKVSGSDATCLYPLPDANGTFNFMQLVNYYCDSDGDTYISAVISGSCTGSGCAPSGCQTIAGTDCNDSIGAINPAAPETCNNLDNNCNGITDENLTRPTTCGLGICSGNMGIETCSAGAWGNNTCNPYAGAMTEGPPGDQTCMDNLDNDCDGAKDTGDIDCHVAFEFNCFDGIDDDWDGMTDCADPDCAGATYGTCVTGQPGICSTGTLTCQAGSSVCVADYGPQAEVCDGLDNNCDGSSDENLTRPTACGVGICSGNTGVETCSGGAWGSNTCDPYAGAQTEGPAGDPSCSDNLDNDCDGETDMAHLGCHVDHETNCYNGIDDDADGMTDCDDDDCAGGPPVRIAGTLPEYFTSIQAAYSSPASIKILQTKGAVFQEDLLFDMDKTVTLEAGYDCGFSNINGKTTVNGNITISGGAVTISNGTLELQ